MAKEIKINIRLIIDGKEQGCDLLLVFVFGHFLLKKIKPANVFLQTKKSSERSELLRFYVYLCHVLDMINFVRILTDTTMKPTRLAKAKTI